MDRKEFLKARKLLNKTQKHLSRNLRQGDQIDAVIKFNDVWTINGKIYVSYELIQFRKLENIEPEPEINYFLED